MISLGYIGCHGNFVGFNARNSEPLIGVLPCLYDTLQIFIVILLYESIKVMEKMYILMIGKLVKIIIEIWCSEAVVKIF